MKAIGLMSGTSLDGLDIAYCEISGSYTDAKVKLLAYGEKKLPQAMKERIQQACSIQESNVEMICSLNFELGKFFGDAVNAFLQEHAINAKEVSFIASHGQTIYHIPFDHDDVMHSTLQIGEPAEIAYRTGIQVISNFRTMDMAAGGQGAPLVPYADYLLYTSKEKNRVLLNIGGISNVTYLKKNAKEEEISAFDTGPGNMMIDEAMRIYFQKEYDADGEKGRSGKVIPELLSALMKIPYITQQPPKSTGRELYGRQKVQEIVHSYADAAGEDLVATFTEYTAKTIADNIHAFLDPMGTVEELIVSGGGAHNRYLLTRIQSYMNGCSVLTQEDLGFSSDAKEAVAFVILGNETVRSHYSNLIAATGAKEKVILGNITPAPRRRP
jgi:Predicted molecular chaperone distantly related to HSP70-fold metalloproteases